MSGFRTELSSQIFKGKTPTILTVLFLLLATLAFSGCNISESSGGKDTKTIGDPTDPDSPQVIKYPGQLPFTDSLSKIDPYTGSGGISYYKIVGLNPGITYRISISSTATFDTYFDSLSVLVYQNPDWSGLECTFSFNSYWSVTSPCPAVSNSEGELYVELTSTVSGKFTLNVEAIVGEGSAAAPIDLTGITPYDTDILDYATSFYKIGGLTPGDSYTVSTSAHSMTMYNDSFTTAICSLSSSCTFTATDNTIWFTVMGAYDDTLFTISFAGNGTPAAIPAEGAIGSEQEITLDTLYSGSVNTSASYYHVSGLTAGSRYRITLSNIFDDNVDLYVFQDATYGSEECFSTAAGTSSEKCETGALAGTELWIEVDGSGALRLLGAYYDLLVEQFFPNEGSGSSTPLELTYDNGLVYSGSVDTVSYYLVSGLAPNTSYVVELRDYTSGNSNISFDLSKTTSSAYSCYTGWEISPGIMTCIITTNADGTIAIDVDEYNYMQGTYFTLEVGLSVLQSEGSTAAPVEIPLGSTPYSGQVAGDASYYQITGLTADESYEITLTAGVAADYSYYIYTSAANLGSTSTYACNGWDGSSSCTRTATGASMWLMVTRSSADVGSTYDIDVAAIPYSAEGSLAAPLALAYGTVSLPHNGQVNVDESYYQITGLTAGVEYTISLSGITALGDIDAYFYTSQANLGSTSYGDYVCGIWYLNAGSDNCLVTPTVDSIWIMVDGYQYSGPAGAEYTLDVTTP